MAVVALARHLADPVAWLPASAWTGDPTVIAPFRPASVRVVIESNQVCLSDQGPPPSTALQWPLAGTIAVVAATGLLVWPRLHLAPTLHAPEPPQQGDDGHQLHEREHRSDIEVQVASGLVVDLDLERAVGDATEDEDDAERREAEQKHDSRRCEDRRAQERQEQEVLPTPNSHRGVCVCSALSNLGGSLGG